ncbi:MAG: hypothetical protein HFI31_16185 [Lachnospiraceae bacterium]|nr:hypothetical protein [Lachnospiraceae bacterium]
MKREKERNENLDIYSWILSPEIRKAWRKEPPLPLLEQAAIVHPAYRPVEEKLEAIASLYARAVTKEEKEKLGQAKSFYETAIRYMRGGDREEVPGEKEPKEVWLVMCSNYDMAQESHPLRMHYYEEPHLVYSYEAAREWASQYVECGWESCLMQKWILQKEKPKDVFTCSARLVKGAFCTTHVYMEELRYDFRLDLWHLPYPLPFSTGDLVKLEGPVFSKTIFGVWDGELGLDEIWYNWMGYIEEKEFGEEPFLTVQNMGYHRLQADELSVLDWLRPASQEELPKEQRILGKIAKTISRVRKTQGEEAAARRFWEVFQINPPKRQKT